jgi:hypothetical protein
MKIKISKILIFVVLIFLTVLLMGCARFPAGPVKTGKQLVITLKVAGRFQPIDDADPYYKRYYFIAIDNDNNQFTGPWAVVAPPFGGNGWVTSAQASKSIGVTSFAEYDAANPETNIYKFIPGSFFLNTTPPSAPIRFEQLDGGSTIRITIDLSQVETTSIPSGKINQLDVNFITTNQLAVNPAYSYPARKWDSIGLSGQDYITIDTTSNRIYSGDDPAGDVNDSDLDIIYWQIEVQQVRSR